MAAAAPIARLVERELFVLRRVWTGLVFTALVQPLLYLLAMGVGLGGLVDERSQVALGGLDYIEFVAPGLLAATAFQLAVGDSLWWVMGGTRWDRRYHAMVASPLNPAHVFGGHLAWVAARTLMAAVPFLIIAALLGAVRSWWAVLALPAATLLVVAVASVVATWSTFTESDRSFPVIMRLGVLPLFLFSGTFFPTSQLPDGLRLLAPVSPLYHGVELCRAATTGISPGAVPLISHVAVLVGVTVIGSWAAIRTFTRRLTP